MNNLSQSRVQTIRTMRLTLFLPLLGMFFVLPLQADDQTTRQIQSALSEAGFYYGKADGKMGEDTRSALRRFQIRNGLDVSGEASAETLAALKIAKKQSEPQNPSPTRPASRIVPSNSAAQDEAQIAAGANRPPSAPINRSFSSYPNDDRASGVSQRSPTREFFAETDMRDLSNEEQTEAIFQAQSQLNALGYYHASPDGLAGRETETALLRFQYANHLRKTGRLDADTRRALDALPQPVSSKPFRRGQNRPRGVILRGIWVR